MMSSMNVHLKKGGVRAGERDVLTKEYLSDSSRFADLMNVFTLGTAGDPAGGCAGDEQRGNCHPEACR